MALWTPPPGRGLRRKNRQAPEQHDKIFCRVCNFPVDVDVQPGGSFPTAFVTTGTTYVWTSADDPVSALDKVVEPVPNTATSCPFCGSTRYLDGNRGTQ